MAWLAVYLLVTAIIITVVRQAHIRYDLLGGEKNFFELTKWDGTTPIFHARYLPQWLFYLPAWVMCDFYAALKYCWLNRWYYLYGGKALRQKYAKRVLSDAIIRYSGHLRFYQIGKERELFPGYRPEDNPWDECSALAPPATDQAYVAGRRRHWAAAELYANALPDEFVSDLIRTPFQFWGLAALSVAQLLFWPITVLARCLWEYALIFVPIAWFLTVQPLTVFLFGRNSTNESKQNEGLVIHEQCRKSHNWAIMQPNAHILTLMPCGHLAHKSQHICNECAYARGVCLWCGQKAGRCKFR